MREKVDPDTGYTPSEQRAKWYECFGKKSAKSVKITGYETKREEAFSYFAKDMTIKEVAIIMDITSGNARYYLKQYKNANK